MLKEAAVVAGPYVQGVVTREGAVLPKMECSIANSPTILSTAPSWFCMRTSQSSSHFTSSSRSGTPLPDSGMLESSGNAAGDSS